MKIKLLNQKVLKRISLLLGMETNNDIQFCGQPWPKFEISNVHLMSCTFDTLQPGLKV